MEVAHKVHNIRNELWAFGPKLNSCIRFREEPNRCTKVMAPVWQSEKGILPEQRRLYQEEMVRTEFRSTWLASLGLWERMYLSCFGRLKTNWRMGTFGSTSSVRCNAISFIRLPGQPSAMQEGQNPRPFIDELRLGLLADLNAYESYALCVAGEGEGVTLLV